MNRTIRFDEAAQAELVEAVRWYDSRRRGLGRELWRVVLTARLGLQQRPETGSLLLRLNEIEVRRRVLPKFPYQFVYYLRREEIIVVAFAHTSRRPHYSQSRV